MLAEVLSGFFFLAAGFAQGQPWDFVLLMLSSGSQAGEQLVLHSLHVSPRSPRPISWFSKELQPYYKKSEQFVTSSKEVKHDLGVQFLDETVHGKNGPIVNSFPEVYGPFQKTWARTYEKLGLGVTGDPRGGLSLGGFA
ncbi:hypothetical protein QC761_0060900 [Podospora bellae-mahoneyi]|uniref:Uncharacterized protein n=1 Tax=Podospora bellae-mahoneyi TaxID=2093777 RepID=A0ABR0FI92_9PEZI|nr:hypothetical protein QC761_0060900 [Podospora bellae-mahoneyi]